VTTLALSSDHFTLQRTGLLIDGAPSFDDCQAALNWVRRAESGVMWWIGDLLNYGEKHYGDKYTKAVEATGMEYKTLAQAKWVCGAIGFSRRRENLSFAHHAEVASLPPPKQDELLSAAESEGWTRAQIRNAAKDFKTQQAIEDAGAINGQFQVILADPPWQYGDERLGTIAGGGAIAQYPTMPLDAICALADSEGRSVSDFAATDSALFLWVPSPCAMYEAPAVIRAWRFEYKAQFVWDKGRGFNGHYNDVIHEVLAIATRGSFVPQSDKLHKSIIRAEKTAHSRKPDVFYEIIESMYPKASKLELFARRPRDGWTSWGNELARRASA
jgi:N6-adenosine-specific RNA methylase IME4